VSHGSHISFDLLSIVLYHAKCCRSELHLKFVAWRIGHGFCAKRRLIFITFFFVSFVHCVVKSELFLRFLNWGNIRKIWGDVNQPPIIGQFIMSRHISRPTHNRTPRVSTPGGLQFLFFSLAHSFTMSNFIISSPFPSSVPPAGVHCNSHWGGCKHFPGGSRTPVGGVYKYLLS